jgi:nucleotide-binding universal stress UspA family protein
VVTRRRCRTILVGVDGSRHAEAAVAFAGRLAAAARARLILASVYRFRPFASRLGSGSEAAEIATVAAQRVWPVHAECHIVPATSPAAGLRVLVVAERVDLVVLGSRHLGHLGEALPGRVAARLVHDCPCPVMVVPGGVAAGPIGSVGVVLEAGAAGERAVAFAASLAADVGAGLRLYARGVTDGTLRGSVALAEGAGAAVTVAGRSVGDDLGSGDLDVLVVPAWPHGLMGRIRRSAARRAVDRCALVVVPPGARPMAVEDSRAISASAR